MPDYTKSIDTWLPVSVSGCEVRLTVAFLCIAVT